MNRSRAWRRVSATLLGAGTVVSAGFAGATVADATPPTVRGGEIFTATVPGFAPGEAVQRRLDRAILPATLRADRHGAVHVRLRVPATPGDHRLLLIGAVAPSGRSTRGDAEVPGEDRQAVIVTVPLMVALDFRVVPGPTVLAESTDGSGGGRPGPRAEPGTTGGVAATGTDVRFGLGLAAALGLVGAVLIACGRRRPASRSPRRA